MRYLMCVAILISVVASPAFAQTSAAQRAQQLAKLEEDMNGDPNLRLAALEAAMESKSIALRTKALSLALASSDANLNAIAIRYKICGMSQILLHHGYHDGNNGFNGFEAGQTAFQVKACDPLNGVGQVEYLDPNGARLRIGNLSVRSRSLSIIFPIGGATCSADLTLDKSQMMVGRLGCPWRPTAFGPVEAKIALN